MGTMSRHRMNTSSVFPNPSRSKMSVPFRISRIKEINSRTNANAIRNSVIVAVSIWRGVFLEVNFFALLSILEAYESSPNAVTVK